MYKNDYRKLGICTSVVRLCGVPLGFVLGTHLFFIQSAGLFKHRLNYCTLSRVDHIFGPFFIIICQFCRISTPAASWLSLLPDGNHPRAHPSLAVKYSRQHLLPDSQSSTWDLGHSPFKPKRVRKQSQHTFILPVKLLLNSNFLPHNPNSRLKVAST